ncbi:MAG: aromatic ring-hydroxylating oxygenase subunit alpha [Ilumatobacteraceae bacterium]
MTDTARPVTIAPRPRTQPPLTQGHAEELLAGIDRGVALPTAWYSDPDLFDAELEGLHRRAWHYVAHVGMIPEPGDVLPSELARVPIVLVRGSDGDVRGFLNICRHRGHTVVLEPGRQRRLTCQYHAWTYGLDGALLGAPRSRGDDLFDPEAHGLVPIQVRVWGPTVWANIDLSAPSFDQWIEGMPERLAANGLTIDDCEYGFDHVWDIDANWKVFQDNTIECYHCPSTHPELSKALEMRPSLQEMYMDSTYWLWHRIPFREGMTEGLTYRAREGEDRAVYYYHWVFPTTYLQYAGKGFDIGSVKVVAPDRIRFHHTCFMPKGTPPDVIETGQQVLPLDATILQDVDICKRVQASHASGVAPRGRMLAEPEWLIRRINRLVVEMTAGLR